MIAERAVSCMRPPGDGLEQNQLLVGPGRAESIAIIQHFEVHPQHIGGSDSAGRFRHSSDSPPSSVIRNEIYHSSFTMHHFRSDGYTCGVRSTLRNKEPTGCHKVTGKSYMLCCSSGKKARRPKPSRRC